LGKNIKIAVLNQTTAVSLCMEEKGGSKQIVIHLMVRLPSFWKCDWRTSSTACWTTCTWSPWWDFSYRNLSDCFFLSVLASI